MDRVRRAALLTRLIEKLRTHGSWCGETHVQKSTLFLQDLMRVPLGFEFILYKHGPFSFDLRDELTSLRADGLTTLEPQYPYGPRIATTDRSGYVQRICAKTMARYDKAIDYVATELGRKGVADLEQLATAFLVTETLDADATVDKRATRLTELKPHISPHAAKLAVEEVDRMLRLTSRGQA